MTLKSSCRIVTPDDEIDSSEHDPTIATGRRSPRGSPGDGRRISDTNRSSVIGHLCSSPAKLSFSVPSVVGKSRRRHFSFAIRQHNLHGSPAFSHDDQLEKTHLACKKDPSRMSYPTRPTGSILPNVSAPPTAHMQPHGRMQPQQHPQQQQQQQQQQQHPVMSQAMAFDPNHTAATMSQTPARQALGGAASFPQFSPSTEEILKRMNTNGGGWEAAREHVLQRMTTTQNIPTPPPAPTGSGRGRGRGGGGATGSAGGGGSSAAKSADTTTTTRKASVAAGTAGSPTTSSGRGRGAGRGRGGGWRGGKRRRMKKEDDDEDDEGIESEDHSSGSEALTSLPTKTKSGRRVHRPTHFDPATKTPTRRRGPYRRHAEATVCRICQRGHSPQSNMIVFCDGCNTPYHQYCHDPPIGEEVVKVEEKEWFCADCMALRRGGETGNLGEVDLQRLVGGEGLSLDEKRAYFTRLPHASLVTLLLHTTSLHPKLPIFSPDAKSLLSQPAPLPATTPAPVSTSRRSISTTSPSTTTTIHQTYPTHQTQPQIDHPMTDILHHHHHQQHQQPLLQQPAFPTQHHPKPGHGIRLPPESEDLTWLVDDDFIAFSHVYHDMPGSNSTMTVGMMGGQQQQHLMQPHQRGNDHVTVTVAGMEMGGVAAEGDGGGPVGAGGRVSVGA